MENLVALMLSDNRIHRDCAAERGVAHVPGTCASNAHLCNVCWPHIRAYLSECPCEDGTQRDALLMAGDRFLLDLVSAPHDADNNAEHVDCGPTAPRDVVGYPWLSLSPDAPVAPLLPAASSVAAAAPLFVHCAVCAKPLISGLVINALGKSFHSKRCFACRVCKLSLADDNTPFFDDGNGMPLCEAHARESSAVEQAL